MSTDPTPAQVLAALCEYVRTRPRPGTGSREPDTPAGYAAELAKRMEVSFRRPGSYGGADSRRQFSDRVTRALANLVKEGVLVKTGQGRGKVRYRTPAEQEWADKILADHRARRSREAVQRLDLGLRLNRLLSVVPAIGETYSGLVTVQLPQEKWEELASLAEKAGPADREEVAGALEEWAGAAGQVMSGMYSARVVAAGDELANLLRRESP
jgi:hypothetical protein